MAAAGGGAETTLQKNRRTVEAVSYGINLLASQLQSDDRSGAPESGRDNSLNSSKPQQQQQQQHKLARDALFAHIRQLIEHSFDGQASLGLRFAACNCVRSREVA